MDLNLNYSCARVEPFISLFMIYLVEEFVNIFESRLKNVLFKVRNFYFYHFTDLNHFNEHFKSDKLVCAESNP